MVCSQSNSSLNSWRYTAFLSESSFGREFRDQVRSPLQVNLSLQPPAGPRQGPREWPCEATWEVSAQAQKSRARRGGAELQTLSYPGCQLAEGSRTGRPGATGRTQPLCCPCGPAVRWEGGDSCKESEPRHRAQGNSSARGGG